MENIIQRDRNISVEVRQGNKFPGMLIEAIARQFRLNRIQKRLIRLRALLYCRHYFTKRYKVQISELRAKEKDAEKAIQDKYSALAARQKEIEKHESRLDEREKKLEEDRCKLRELLTRHESAQSLIMRGTAQSSGVLEDMKIAFPKRRK